MPDILKPHISAESKNENLAPSCTGLWFLGLYPDMKVIAFFAGNSPWFSKRIVAISLWPCISRAKETMPAILGNQINKNTSKTKGFDFHFNKCQAHSRKLKETSSIRKPITTFSMILLLHCLFGRQYSRTLRCILELIKITLNKQKQTEFNTRKWQAMEDNRQKAICFIQNKSIASVLFTIIIIFKI